MRVIPAGEEVTFDYGTVLYPVPGCPPYRLECGCGSPLCRGMVTDNDWQRLDLQRRYAGWFSWYLQEKINRSL